MIKLMRFIQNIKLALAFSPLFMAGCEPGVSTDDKCDLGHSDYATTFDVDIINKTGNEFYYSNIARVFTVDNEPRYNEGGVNFESMNDINIVNERRSFTTSILYECDDWGYPPDDGMAYQIWLFTIIDNDEKKHFVAVGGSKEDYEAFIPKNDKYPIPDNAEVVAYNLAFVPGKQLREELGLKVDNPSNTEIYTFLDSQKRAYSGFDGFHLKITINKASAEGFSFDYSGDVISTSSVTAIKSAITGKSGASSP